MKQVLVKEGGVIIEEVPAPSVSHKSILVQVHYSCVSIGTEMAGVAGSGLSLYRRMLKQPEKVKQVWRMVQEKGLKQTQHFLSSKLSAANPTGYSAAGIVVAVGSEVLGFAIGDRVACAGASAHHAEIIHVPVNLAVKIPDGVNFDEASTVTLGAIAMQGIRRAAPTLGETVVVIGLGILGQLTTQLLRINGCRVIGVDLAPERIQLALQNGMEQGINPNLERYVDRVYHLTEGMGADAVIVTAATSSDQVMSEAMQACRKKGRVVLVGDVGLNLNRADFYKKELDFLISTSYGPGRYDDVYEKEGQDYPLPYVRWTENRNMESYLQLLAQKNIILTNLKISPFSIDEAKSAYEQLKTAKQKPLLVLLSYPERPDMLEKTIPVAMTMKKGKSGAIRTALIGAGGFAQSTHLPNIKQLHKHYQLHAVMSRTGSNAKAIAQQFNAAYATTDYKQILSDAEIDLVLITTRHHLHGSMVIDALKANKHVFVEKPLAITPHELHVIRDFFRDATQAPLLMTGFNRRFSPAIRRAKAILTGRTTPLIINYRMNASYLPTDVWVHGEEGGGRNIGEACHIYDLFNFFCDAAVVNIQASAMIPRSKQWGRNDNFVAIITYADGSVCSLTYTAMGSTAHPKEQMDIYADGKVLSLDDYKLLQIKGAKYPGWSSSVIQKGHLNQFEALAASLQTNNAWPISIDHQISATEISFEVERQIQN